MLRGIIKMKMTKVKIVRYIYYPLKDAFVVTPIIASCDDDLYYYWSDGCHSYVIKGYNFDKVNLSAAKDEYVMYSKNPNKKIDFMKIVVSKMQEAYECDLRCLEKKKLQIDNARKKFGI